MSPAQMYFIAVNIHLFCLIKYPVAISVWETTSNDPVGEWTVQMNQTESWTVSDLFANLFDGSIKRVIHVQIWYCLIWFIYDQYMVILIYIHRFISNILLGHSSINSGNIKGL